MTCMQKFLGASAVLALSAGAAVAEPALIFDLGGKFDKSFNEAAFGGAQRWAEETEGTFREIELSSEAQREQALRRFAEAGANPVIMTGIEIILNGVSHGPRGFSSWMINLTKRPNSPLTLTSLFIAHPLCSQNLLQHQRLLPSQTHPPGCAYLHLKVR